MCFKLKTSLQRELFLVNENYNLIASGQHGVHSKNVKNSSAFIQHIRLDTQELKIVKLTLIFINYYTI